MKRIIIALMVAVTFCSLAMAQNPTITQDNKNSSDSTIVTEYTDIVDSSTVDTDYQSSSFDFGNEFPFNIDKGAINGGILTGLVVIILIFGFPFFIVFIAFYFRYKNRKAKYRLMEQALATGQPLPEGIFKDTLPQDYRTKGIKNICTGIGLFIFLWAITDEFSIGCIGLLVMFTGIGQWIISRNQQHERPEDPFTCPTHKDETLNEQK